MMINRTILFRTEAAVSSCCQSNWLTTLAQLESQPRQTATSTTAEAMTIRVPFALWIVVILCFIAWIVIDLVSPKEQPAIYYYDIDDDTSACADIPSLSDGSSHSSLTIHDEASSKSRHVGKFGKVLNFIRKRQRRRTKTIRGGGNHQLGGGVPHSPPQTSSPRIIHVNHSKHQHQHHMTVSGQAATSSLDQPKRKMRFGRNNAVVSRILPRPIPTTTG
jgi:hypothetical protein